MKYTERSTENYACDSLFSHVCLLEGMPPLFPTGIPFLLLMHLTYRTRKQFTSPLFPQDKEMFLRI